MFRHVRKGAPATPNVRSPRSNLYDSLCKSCARAEDTRSARDAKAREKTLELPVGSKNLVYCTAGGGCCNIAGGGSLCLTCCRLQQRCLYCGVHLEVVFHTGAKFTSFKRFPEDFRRETRLLMLVCNRLQLTRDVRILLVKALSREYEKLHTLGAQLVTLHNDEVRVEVFRVQNYAARVWIHVYPQVGDPPKEFRVLNCMRASRHWKVQGAKLKDPHNGLPAPTTSTVAARYNAVQFAVNFEKSWALGVDPLQCSFVLTEARKDADAVSIEFQVK